MSENVTLRLARLQDADLLLSWRNEPATRQASHNTALITRDEHCAWLSQLLGDGARQLYIAEENGQPVGTVRADLSGGVWVLSWSVSFSARGRGLAKRMVKHIVGQIHEPVRAEVKIDNRASARIAEAAGLLFERESDGVLYYQRAALDV